MTDIIQPIVENLGYELWDIRFIKEGTNWYLRIFIDKKNDNKDGNSIGISTEDCEKVSRAIEEPIDKVNPIEHFYYLEVCSPGLERELVKEQHLIKYRNEKVKVRLIRKDKENNKEIIGKLSEFDKEKIYILCENDKKLVINRNNISHINVFYEFNFEEI